MPRRCRYEFVHDLGEIEAEKVALDERLIAASRKAIAALKSGTHVFRQDSGRIVTITVDKNDADYVDVEIAEAIQL